MSLKREYKDPYICKMPAGFRNLKMNVLLALKDGYNKIVVPVNPTGLPPENCFIAEQAEDTQNITIPDPVLKGYEWFHNTIVLLSDNFDCDSTDPMIRKTSEQVFLTEFSQAENLVGISKIMIRLKSGNNTNLARLCARKRRELLIIVPAYSSKELQQKNRRDSYPLDKDAIEENDSWNWWNNFRRVNTNTNVKPVIELSADMIPDKYEIIHRWLCEPLEAVIVPSSLFIYDDEITMHKDWEKVIKCFLRCYINIIISGDFENNDWPRYVSYLRELHESLKCTYPLGNDPATREQYLNTYYPVTHNFTSTEYEYFEADKVKYAAYQAAVAEVIANVSQTNQSPVVIIVNAGRGNLVYEVLLASELAQQKVLIFAIESNPGAAHSLRKIVQTEWKHLRNVFVVEEDPRDHDPEIKADILVFEMYGCYGDTELAPEFINPVIHKLLKPNGICIPERSIAKISPVMSPILHRINKLESNYGDNYETRYTKCQKHPDAHFQTILGSGRYLGEDKILNDFCFPENSTPLNSYNYYKVFKIPVVFSGLLNGFAVQSTLILTEEIILTQARFIEASRAASWFPMYFPLTTPMNVKKGDVIEINFWRNSNKYKIWYEWCLTSPRKTRIFNKEGRCQCLYLRNE